MTHDTYSHLVWNKYLVCHVTHTLVSGKEHATCRQNSSCTYVLLIPGMNAIVRTFGGATADRVQHVSSLKSNYRYTDVSNHHESWVTVMTSRYTKKFALAKTHNDTTICLAGGSSPRLFPLKSAPSSRRANFELRGLGFVVKN